jgi:hypothetical protein
VDGVLLDRASLTRELRSQLEARPYLTIGALFGLGLLAGRRLPLRALLPIAGLGARMALATALEAAIKGRAAAR